MRRVDTRRGSAALLARNATYAVFAPSESTVSTARAQFQAYCGPAHGQRWPVEDGSGPPDVVQIQTPGGICSYRLLVHPRTHGPARDQQGRYPYLPLAPGAREVSLVVPAVAAGGMPGTA